MVDVLRANFKRKPFIAFLLVSMAALGACVTGNATRSGSAIDPGANTANANLLMAVNRISWGVNSSTMQHVAKLGLSRYLDEQLFPSRALPPAVADQIAAMSISQQPLVVIVQNMEQRRKDADAIKDDDAKKVAQQAYQAEMSRLAREAARRAIYLVPDLAVGHFVLATIAARQHDRARARGAFRRAAELAGARPADELVALGDGETAGRFRDAAVAQLALLDAQGPDRPS